MLVLTTSEREPYRLTFAARTTLQKSTPPVRDSRAALSVESINQEDKYKLSHLDVYR